MELGKGRMTGRDGGCSHRTGTEKAESRGHGTSREKIGVKVCKGK